MSRTKVNLNNLKQTHGALIAPSTIDELTGRSETYSVGSLEEYRELLTNMTDDEMQQHAVDVAGVVPVSIRSLLIDRLEDKFVVTTGRRNIPTNTPSKISRKNQDFQREFFRNSQS